VPCQCNTRGALSKLKSTPPRSKINVTSKSPVGDISVVTLIRTDTTLDHSQKAEKVCLHVSAVLGPSTPRGKEVSWFRPGSTRQLRSAPPRGTTRNTSAISFVSARRLSRKCILGVIAIYAIVAVQGEYKDAAGDACPLQISNPSNSEVSMFSLCIRHRPMRCERLLLGARAPAKIKEVTLMRPIHGNL
jgi:hypothetical protein